MQKRYIVFSVNLTSYCLVQSYAKCFSKNVKIMGDAVKTVPKLIGQAAKSTGKFISQLGTLGAGKVVDKTKVALSKAQTAIGRAQTAVQSKLATLKKEDVTGANKGVSS